MSATSEPPTAVLWDGAPTDGVWADEHADDVPYGSLSEPNPRADYVFGIKTMPALTTEDDGISAKIASDLVVHRVSEKWPGQLLQEDLPIYWSAGELLPENSQDETHGTNIDIRCQPAEIKLGQTGVCTLQFTGAAAEMKDSYWNVWGQRIGTWPSQK